MLAGVELPYRVIDTAAGDLGSSAARKFDCEAWLPIQERYLRAHLDVELHRRSRPGASTSASVAADGATRAVATLNGTLATTRWIVALLENHQQPDGSVHVPAALRPYLGGLQRMEPVGD